MLVSGDQTLGCQTLTSGGTAVSGFQFLVLRETDLWGHAKTGAAASHAPLPTDRAPGSAAVPGD